jgi:hypothetical protein
MASTDIKLGTSGVSNGIPSSDQIDTSNDQTGNSSPVNENVLKAEFKKGAFNREFRALFKQSEETINARYGMTMELGDVRAELICLKRYLAIYNNTSPQEHYRYFETLYNRKRPEILNCLKDDRWIRTGNIIIQFGDGTKSTREIEEKRKQVRIMLSDIFLIACDLQEQAEKSLDGIDESFAQAAGGKDLIRPNIILLHLMRIFYFLNDSADKVLLGEIVTRLEDDLGVPVKTVNVPGAEIPVPVPTASPSATGGLSGLFTMATNMMEKMGYKPPPGMKPPSENEISNVISTVFNNETTQTAIQGMFSSLQGCTDFGSAVQEVVKNVTDPKTMEAIQGSVMQTAQLASFDNPQQQPQPQQPQSQQQSI